MNMPARLPMLLGAHSPDLRAEWRHMQRKAWRACCARPAWDACPGLCLVAQGYSAALATAAAAKPSLPSCAVLSLQPRSGGAAAAAGGWEATVGELAARVLAGLPPQFDVEAISKRFPTSYQESMNTVLVQVCAPWQLSRHGTLGFGTGSGVLVRQSSRACSRILPAGRQAVARTLTLTTEDDLVCCYSSSRSPGMWQLQACAAQ
jgi:hypothetical protein